jgi:hypothetical protein
MPKASAYLKGIAPKATLHDLDAMMWNCTPYPFARASLRKLRRGLRKYFRLGGNSISGAVGYANDELSYDFDRGERDRHPECAEGYPPSPAPQPYPKRPPPAHLPTRQYSRKLNRALKFRDVAGFSNLLSTPPPGLECGWWLDDLVHQIAASTGPEERLEAVQVKMFSALLSSGLPIDEGAFSVALGNRNYPLLRLLIVHELTPQKRDWFSLNREVMWQLMDGYWPYPDAWCEDALNACAHLQCFGRFFPREREPAPAGFCQEHILRMSTLPVGDDFKMRLSVFYAEFAAKKDFALLSTPRNQLALGTLIELGWIDEKVVLSKAKLEHREMLLDVMHHALRVHQHDQLTRLVGIPDLTRPINRL